MTAPRIRSQCAVALLADVPGTGHLGQAQARRFPLAGEDLAAICGDFVEFARGQVESGARVVALYPSWRATPAQRAIAFARGALAGDDIAGIGINGGPLTLSLVADQLAYLAPYLPPGMVAAMARELPRHLLGGAWLKSVAKLDALPTSMAQHLSSYTPGSAFLALCAPKPHVVQVHNDDANAGIPMRPGDPVQVLLAPADGMDMDPFEYRLRPALRPSAVRSLPQQPLARDYYGTRRFLEFVALSAHPGALTRAVNGIGAAPCAWCGEPTARRQCAFCGAVNPPVPAAPPPGPEPRSGIPAANGEAARLLTMAPSGRLRSEPEQPAERRPPVAEPAAAGPEALAPLPEPTPLPPESPPR